MSIQPQLKRFDLTMIVVSLIIGVGIFRTPAIVASSAGKEWVFYMAWITGGIVSIFGALTFAEIGARLPSAGGYYRIFSTSYHPAYAFMLNWSQVIINAGSSAGVALIGAEFITPVLFPGVTDAPSIERIIAFIIIMILFGINFAGIKMGARTQNLLSILKIAMILVFCFAIFGKHAPAEKPIEYADWNFIHAFGASLIAIFFTYGGYQQTVNFGADVKDPNRNIPQAIFMGVGIVIILYMIINVAYVKVLGFNHLASAELVARDLAIALFGDTGGTIVSIVLFTSVLGFLNTSVMSNPRVYYAMAEDKVLPPIFKQINNRTQVQQFGLSFFVAIMIVSLYALGSFDKIVNYVLFIDSISLASAAAALFILRKKGPANYSGFKMPGYPVIPALFIIVLLFVTYNTIEADIKSASNGFYIFLMGLPLYFILKRVVEKSEKPK